jgi:hypothetical protein
MAKQTEKTWAGDPGPCDFCKAPFMDRFYDAATRQGPWACMCPKCWAEQTDTALGTGHGQRYDKRQNPDGTFRWVKTAG